MICLEVNSSYVIERCSIGLNEVVRMGNNQTILENGMEVLGDETIEGDIQYGVIVQRTDIQTNPLTS